MDYELNDDQRAILAAVATLLDKYAGPARAIELQAAGDYDFALDAAIRDAGFADVARSQGTGALEAALVAESVAQAAGVVSFAAAALVAAAVVEEELPGPISLTTSEHRGPVRFCAHARTLLVLDRCSSPSEPQRQRPRQAWVVALEPGDSQPVASNFGYPMGSCPSELQQRGTALAPGAAEQLESWWRVALAIEAAGTMRAALDQTVEYLKQRRQFGRAIGSFQAVQHRLASCAIAVEASRWLAYEAAFQGAPAEAAATAAAYASAAAPRIFAETHQLSGAIGFTREHDLHVFSMRLQALRLELGGVRGHRRGLAAARWGDGKSP
jgi:alkylation response protein AidB-like acyl-CoA dehydrogenase